MSNVRDSGGYSPDDTQLGGGTQTLDREPDSKFPVQKVAIGAVVGILVIAVVVLGVYVSRQGKADTSATMKTSTRSDVYDGIPVTIRETGNVQDNRRTMRVVSARGDLTGQRELAWPADKGTAVGDAHCTQNFQFNAQSLPGIRPTLMICWRTSKDRSVYTVAVDVANKPSMDDSVAVLDKAWNAMG
jgi:hypothetical protein